MSLEEYNVDSQIWDGSSEHWNADKAPKPNVREVDSITIKSLTFLPTDEEAGGPVRAQKMADDYDKVVKEWRVTAIDARMNCLYKQCLGPNSWNQNIIAMAVEYDNKAERTEGAPHEMQRSGDYTPWQARDEHIAILKVVGLLVGNRLLSYIDTIFDKTCSHL